MITKIIATGMKGLSFEQSLSKHTIIIGDNGSGKSARSETLQLVVNGFVPGVDRTNPDILDAFGTNGKLKVAIQINGEVLERAFKMGSKGSVKQTYKDRTGNVSKNDFIASLATAGNHKVLDLQAFLDMSDSKKIDMIFRLYPPKGDINKLNDQIEKRKEKLSLLRGKMHTAEKLAQKLIVDRTQLELPAGTLAEITVDIDRTKAELRLANQHLKKLEIEEAAAKAKKEAEDKAKADTEAKAEADRKKAKAEAKTSPSPETEKRPTERNVSGFSGGRTVVPEALVTPHPGRAIKAIIEAIQSVGCDACARGAGYLVAKRELKRFGG